MKLSELKTKPLYLPSWLYDQYDNQLVIVPKTDDLVLKTGSEDIYDCPIICLNNNTEYLLTMKTTGTLSLVTELIKQSFQQDCRPVLVIRSSRANGYNNGKPNFYTDYSRSKLMELSERMAIYHWADTNRCEDFRGIADRFVAYTKKCSAPGADIPQMACHFHEWLMDNDFDIPPESEQKFAAYREMANGTDNL